MAKKNEVKKAAGKAKKSSRPAQTTKAMSDETKIPAKMIKEPAPARSEITFTLEAPQAEQVCVVGSFNGWDPRANLLERDEDGAWRCTLVVDPGEHEYRFFVDGQWCDDLANMLRRPNGFGTENCVLIV